ncbi:MAG: proteasome accessory factor PafA2 family protein [Candidatus Korobacteraceae bacterium]
MSGSERLFGAETEYAVTAMHGGKAVDRGEILQAMMDQARQRLVHLPDLCSGGMFLENGSRFYVDCGLHPELATPECVDPWSVVRYIKAGNEILSDLVQAASSASAPGTEVMCFRCNVDYSGAHTTWGSHESYLHTMNPASLQPQIVPHLVSRIIYTGAGGFNPTSSGLEFTLSPRVAFISRVASADSTSDRGVFHSKNEPLCGDGHNRLHVICGESLCSDTAMFLKAGTTALIVAMAEAGVNPGGDVQIESALDALRTFAADTTCKKPVRMKNWRRLTAIEIQRHYLQQAELHAHEDYMPAWAGDVCRVWSETLARLSDDPCSTESLLDWSMKRSLYADQAAKLGIRWERLTLWNEIANRLNAALAATTCGESAMNLDFVLGPQNPIPDEVDRLTKFLRLKGLDWEELKQLLDARRRFFEIDTRFGQLGPKGIFHSLDSAGVLRHRVNGIDNAECARSEPPFAGRARVRGQAVRRLSSEPGAWRCDWQYIVNSTDGRMLDLSNPFASEEAWSKCSEVEADTHRNRFRLLSYLDSVTRRA